METEIEAKFPDIDPKALIARLTEIGAKQEYPEVLMKRKTLDLPNKALYQADAWVRVRDEGNKITLAYKQLNSRTLHGMKEVSIVVNDFDKTIDFLTALGLEVKSYQETKREKWHYEDVEITIDTWPWIPPFVELEGPSEVVVRSVAKKLGFDWGRALYGSVEPVYQMHYDVTDQEIDAWESITFTPLPAWLRAKKK